MSIFRATQAFTFDTKRGTPRTFTPGDLIESSDPDFKGKEHLFEPVEDAAARSSGVETATAEPGAHRSVSSPLIKRRGRKAFSPTPVVADEPAPADSPATEEN